MNAREIAHAAGGPPGSRYRHLPRELDGWWQAWVAGMVAWWTGIGLLWLAAMDVPAWLFYPAWLTGVGQVLGSTLLIGATAAVYYWGVRSEVEYGTPVPTIVLGVLVSLPVARGALYWVDWLWSLRDKR